MEKLFSVIDDNYKELITKVLSDKATSEEVALLKRWLLEAEENYAYFKQMSQTWQITSTIQESRTSQAENAWLKAKPLISSEKQKRHYSFSVMMKVAAFWILTFLLGGVITYFAFKKNISIGLAENVMNEVIAPIGSKSKIVLPDGTTVWLNAGSKIRYSQAYNMNDRNVYLEGEAYFKVHTNPAKPFIVNANSMKIKAYGTAFNVKAYPEEGTITTTLVEGHVKIEGINETHKFEVSLKPNQKLTYFKTVEEKPKQTNIIKQKPDIENSTALIEKKPVVVENDVKTNLYTSWKDDCLVMAGEELEKVVVMLQRRYNVKFVYKSDALKKYKITGTVRKETLDQVLDLLKLTTPLKYEIKGGLVILEPDKARSENYSKVMN